MHRHWWRAWKHAGKAFKTGLLIVCIISLSFASRPAPSRAQASDRFSVTQLGTLGGAQSVAYAINDQGWVVGDAQTSTGESHAFIWKDGVMTDLFAGCAICGNSHAQAINNTGQVVGWAARLPSGESNTGFIWQDGQLTALGPVPGFGSDQFQPYGINAQGVVVGGVLIGAIAWAPLIYSGGQWTRIGPDDRSGLVTSINDAGQVAGFICDALSQCPFGSNIPHAFRYSGGMLDIIPATLGTRNKALGIAGNGDVVGFAFDCCDLAPPTHAVQWHKSGSDWVATDLLAGMPGGDHARARSSNATGEIFGCIETASYHDAYCLNTSPAFLAGVTGTGGVVRTTFASIGGCDIKQVGLGNSLGAFAATGSCSGGPLRAQVIVPYVPPHPAYKKAKPDDCIYFVHPDEAAPAPMERAPGLSVWQTAVGVGLIITVVATVFIEFVCKDPFDPNFSTVTPPEFPPPQTVPDDPCAPPDLTAEINQAFDAWSQADGTLRATMIALNRLQTAYTLGYDSQAELQANAIDGYVPTIKSRLLALQAGLRDAGGRIQGTPCDVSVTQDDIAAFIADVQARGVDAIQDFVPLLQQYGIDPAAVVQHLVVIDPSTVPLTLSDTMIQAADAIKDAADEYEGMLTPHYASVQRAPAFLWSSAMTGHEIRRFTLSAHWSKWD